MIKNIDSIGRELYYFTTLQFMSVMRISSELKFLYLYLCFKEDLLC